VGANIPNVALSRVLFTFEIKTKEKSPASVIECLVSRTWLFVLKLPTFPTLLYFSITGPSWLARMDLNVEMDSLPLMLELLGFQEIRSF
jgi:hypothetical protein